MQSSYPSPLYFRVTRQCEKPLNGRGLCEGARLNNSLQSQDVLTQSRSSCSGSQRICPGLPAPSLASSRTASPAAQEQNGWGRPQGPIISSFTATSSSLKDVSHPTCRANRTDPVLKLSARVAVGIRRLVGAQERAHHLANLRWWVC
jgi:hypothetical protein